MQSIRNVYIFFYPTWRAVGNREAYVYVLPASELEFIPDHVF